MLGAPKKVLIFTESRRTQEYLKSFLQNNGYKKKSFALMAQTMMMILNPSIENGYLYMQVLNVYQEEQL